MMISTRSKFSISSLLLMLCVSGCSSPVDPGVEISAATSRVEGVAQSSIGLGSTGTKSAESLLPRDYVVTPFGALHRSCVLEVGARERLAPEQKAIVAADGTT